MKKTTVELTNCNLRNELKEFQAYVIRFNKEIKDQSLVDQFLEDK